MLIIVIFFFFWFQVVILAKSGAIMDAVSVLATAVLLKSPYFVKKLEFSQEVVRQKLFHYQDETNQIM